MFGGYFGVLIVLVQVTIRANGVVTKQVFL